jgi:hypothetical protein
MTARNRGENYDWTAEAIDTAKTMWDAGASAREIAEALPGNPSRNAVIGKLHRLGSKAHTRPATAPKPNCTPIARRQPSRPVTPRRTRTEPKEVEVMIKPPPVTPDTPIEFKPEAVTAPASPNDGVEYLQLKWFHCRELIGGRGSDGLLLSCGKPKVIDAEGRQSSYCREHHAKNTALPYHLRKERA